MSESSLQERYDRSVRETDEAIERATAERPTAEKVFDRYVITGTGLDLVLAPFVALGHAIAVRVRGNKARRT